MLLVARVVAEFFAVAEDTVKTGKHLFGGKLGFVIGFWNFENKEGAFDVFDDINALVIAPSKINEHEDNGQPDVPLQERAHEPRNKCHNKLF